MCARWRSAGGGSDELVLGPELLEALEASEAIDEVVHVAAPLRELIEALVEGARGEQPLGGGLKALDAALVEGALSQALIEVEGGVGASIGEVLGDLKLEGGAVGAGELAGGLGVFEGVKSQIELLIIEQAAGEGDVVFELAQVSEQGWLEQLPLLGLGGESLDIEPS